MDISAWLPGSQVHLLALHSGLAQLPWPCLRMLVPSLGLHCRLTGQRLKGAALSRAASVEQEDHQELGPLPVALVLQLPHQSLHMHIPGQHDAGIVVKDAEACR